MSLDNGYLTQVIECTSVAAANLVFCFRQKHRHAKKFSAHLWKFKSVVISMRIFLGWGVQQLLMKAFSSWTTIFGDGKIVDTIGVLNWTKKIGERERECMRSHRKIEISSIYSMILQLKNPKKQVNRNKNKRSVRAMQQSDMTHENLFICSSISVTVKKCTYRTKQKSHCFKIELPPYPCHFFSRKKFEHGPNCQ